MVCLASSEQATPHGLFASKDFIAASRRFVCVRLDSYESAAHQKFVRTFLDGRFENSVFCLLAPNGKDRLSRGGRGPEMVLGRHSATSELLRVANDYTIDADLRQAVVQDFHSARPALNVASADQRVLVLVHGSADKTKPLRHSLRDVFSHPELVGCFHVDFEPNDGWKKQVSGSSSSNGIYMIRPGEFGLRGAVMNRLPLNVTNDHLRQELLSANNKLAQTTEKKVYSSHVRRGP